MKIELTIGHLLIEAGAFANSSILSGREDLYGANDGKTIGTIAEQAFREFLMERFEFEVGSSAKGIDFPGLNTDMKVTSNNQPQSSCLYSNARQKVYGLGYHLLLSSTTRPTIMSVRQVL